MNAYEEIVDFIAGGPSVRSVADFQASRETQTRVRDLIRKEKNEGLTGSEKAELDNYMVLEHIMRLVKAKARGHLAHG
jgi:hypothetical protein